MPKSIRKESIGKGKRTNQSIEKEVKRTRQLFNSAKEAYTFIQTNKIQRWEIIGQGKSRKVILNYNWRKILLLSLIRKLIQFIVETLDLNFD
jgi:hypothetical protein